MKCLLVDDEPGIREGLAALLRKKGHDVRTAGDCAAAAAALAHEFDVVVTDWRLPDGTADSYWAAARCPVVAVSGHPEEVVRDGRVQAVLQKPVTPTKLVAVLQALTAGAADGVATTVSGAPSASLPIDVQRAIAAFGAQLPGDAVVEVHDDGTFVTVLATIVPRGEAPLPPVQAADGELSLRRHAGGLRAQLRLRRDGRPASAMPVCSPDALWPAQGTFAVDFHDTSLSAAQFAACLACAAEVRRRGGRVQLLNVPDALLPCVSSHGTAHDMPMREPVGPSLQAEFADLWREP